CPSDSLPLSGAPPALPPFPTRRSSDLGPRAWPPSPPAPRRSPRRRCPGWISGWSCGVPQSSSGEGGEDLRGAAPDAEETDVAVLAAHLGLGHVAEPAEELQRLVRDPFRALDGGVLGKADLGDRVVPGGGEVGAPVGVGAGQVDAARHLGDGVLHALA